MTIQQTALSKLLLEFPNAATKTLANVAFQRFPELWTSSEAARTALRMLRGASGSRRRDICSIKDHYREPRKPGDPFGALPKPKETLAKWRTVDFPGPARVLVLTDVHIPYHDNSALSLALQHGVKHQADTVLLNGDIADFFSVSFWEKDPRERDFAGEIGSAKQFLGHVRHKFPKAHIVYKLGNHEERFLRYMRVKAPELLGLPDFDLQNVLGLAEHRIELIADQCPIRIGELHFLHGHEYRFAISNPVNPARGLFLRGKVHALCGHFHQSSQHSEKSLAQHVISTWSTGCLCDLHPEYRPLNNWNHGFAFVEVDKRGAFQVSNLRIVDGKVWN